jgi:3-methyladenine DNA glycosylase Mpg
MHKLRINISVKPKTMINSPEVCFDITRQHAQVGHKNINIYSYKNHLGRFCIKGNQFI